MQSLNIADAGFGYIFKCIGLYYEGNIYFILYLLSLAFLCLAWDDATGFRRNQSGIKGIFGSLGVESESGKPMMAAVFLPQFVLMAITVYNPVFPVALNSFFDVNKEYYRFLWMSPVITCIAVAGVIVVTEYAGSAVRQGIAVVFILCLLVAGGSYLYKDGYILSPNIYQVGS